MARRKFKTEELEEKPLEMSLGQIDRSEVNEEGFEPIVLHTSRGPIDLRYYPAERATGGAIFVGGAGGGWDTPVRGWLYPRMCQSLPSDGVAGLRVKYRHANDLEECTLDVLGGVHFLEREGIGAVAVVGHSFGGAVVIQAAAHSRTVRTCVPLSTQSHGADAARLLGPQCSILLGHGTDDSVLPAHCSQYVYSISREPKKLLLKEGANHGLDEWSEELPQILRNWIVDELDRVRDEPAGA